MEYLVDGSPDCPLIRLFDFDRTSVAALRSAVKGLADGDSASVDLASQDLAKSVGGCELVLRTGNRDLGVSESCPLHFECVLMRDTFDDMAVLMEPFCDSAKDGFQWLTEHSKISLLLSSNGKW